MPLVESRGYVEVPLLRPRTVPDGSTVELAFVARATRPVAADFVPAEWHAEGGRVFARTLIGPDGGLELEAGLFDVFARVDAAPEDAWIAAGSLRMR